MFFPFSFLEFIGQKADCSFGRNIIQLPFIDVEPDLKRGKTGFTSLKFHLLTWCAPMWF